jgi:tetratricopeptide (TPR) repeat protein
MLTSLGESAPPQALTHALSEATEGNAFFVTELISHLNTERLLFDDSGNWRQDLTGALDIPHSIRAVIQRRLAALTDDVRKVFSVASVVGRQFSFDLLDSLHEVEADTLLESLDEGVRSGMLQQVERSAAEFRFTHQLTQHTLYDEIPALRRQRAHLRVAEALADLRPYEPERIAYHYTCAGSMAPVQESRKFLVLAAEKATSIAAWEDAAQYFQQALALPGELGVDERARLLWHLGEAQGGKGEWEPAVDNLTQAMDLFESIQDTDSLSWIAYALRRLYGARGQFNEAAEVVERALSALGDAESEIRSRLLAQAGFIRSAFGEVAEAERLLEQSRAIAERTGEPAAIGFSGFITGMHCMSYCRLREAADWLTRSLEWSLAGNDLWTASQASSFRKHILFALGQPERSAGAMDEEERLARRAGNFLAVCETKWIGSGIACLSGKLDEAESLARELIHLIQAAHADSGLPGALINLSYIQFLKGDEQAFEELLGDALAVYARMSAAPIDDPKPVQFLLRVLAGRRDAALKLIPELEGYFDFGTSWTTSNGEARVTLAGAFAALADRDRAAQLYPPLKEWTESTGYVLTGASTVPQLVSRILGMAAGVTGAHDDAVSHFEHAINIASSLGLDAELAECHYWFASYLFSAGDERKSAALSHLDQATGIWQAAAMPQQLPRAELLRSTI